MAVHGSTWQYMTVHGSTWHYMIEHFFLPTDSMLVCTVRQSVISKFFSIFAGSFSTIFGAWILRQSTHFMAVGILRLKNFPAESADFADSAGRHTNACTNRFIHHNDLLPLPGALAPFAYLAAGGCSAAAWGLGIGFQMMISYF
jgi:hypothetical protein